jgi:hypothetical protein
MAKIATLARDALSNSILLLIKKKSNSILLESAKRYNPNTQ